MGSPAVREPQQDRSRATRQRLLEAAVECLAERGFAGSTVTVVAERAGVSRGAAQHHFPTREELFLAAVRYVSEVRMQEIGRQAATLGAGSRRTEALMELLADLYTGQLFRAALHLWVAAAAEPQMREAIVSLEAELGREAHRAVIRMLGVPDTPGVRETVQATLDLLRGLGLGNLLTDDSARRAGIVRQWARMLDSTLPKS
ncbi:TetR/AcrR family transcriptional regulator [Fodinicola feengrottensis]|uniref:TetR/AcrR family transcriptional regulator n=1 Tax=Fodinicola feengrottensis TaxID=435914 RepID=A0ABN2HZZ5_9ACTN|nr:TetR/AcrR family transcriptional regulator [Fodinicola feengrottensis]